MTNVNKSLVFVFQGNSQWQVWQKKRVLEPRIKANVVRTARVHVFIPEMVSSRMTKMGKQLITQKGLHKDRGWGREQWCKRWNYHFLGFGALFGSRCGSIPRIKPRAGGPTRRELSRICSGAPRGHASSCAKIARQNKHKTWRA